MVHPFGSVVVASDGGRPHGTTRGQRLCRAQAGDMLNPMPWEMYKVFTGLRSGGVASSDPYVLGLFMTLLHDTTVHMQAVKAAPPIPLM